jgi:acyl-CoA reductase-like NAD-dependent aldehyde dehydrogenase
MGGKNPVWLDKTYDLNLAAKRILWARCLNTGQVCLSPEYVMLPAELMEKFIKQLRKVSNEFYGGNPMLSNSYNGKIINKFHFDRLKTLLQTTNGMIFDSVIDFISYMI